MIRGNDYKGRGSTQAYGVIWRIEGLGVWGGGFVFWILACFHFEGNIMLLASVKVYIPMKGCVDNAYKTRTFTDIPRPALGSWVIWGNEGWGLFGGFLLVLNEQASAC